jgi:hypothetical protein
MNLDLELCDEAQRRFRSIKKWRVYLPKNIRKHFLITLIELI